MSRALVVILAALLAPASCLTAEAEVLQLTASNFSEVVQAPGARVLVMFYAPWCSYCKRLMPIYDEAARRVVTARHDDAELVGRLAVIDATAERSVAARYSVNGYPALRWFAAGEVSDYHGGQTADDLEDWVISRGGPLVKALSNDSIAEPFRLSYPLVVIASFRAPPESDKIETLRQLCSSVDSLCGLKQVETPTNESIVLHRASDDASITYAGELTDLHGLRRFVVAHSLYAPQGSNQRCPDFA